jgi:hypothetical protein
LALFSPVSSSREATNWVPAGSGRKLTVTPVEFVAVLGIGIENGRELKGMRVKELGMALAFSDPEKEIETGSH